MRMASEGQFAPRGADDGMAADVVCTAGAGPTVIQTVTINLEGPELQEVLISAEVRGRFAAAGPGEVAFQVDVDGVPLNALVAPDIAVGVVNTVTYAQQDAAADEVVPVTMVRLVLLAAGARVVTLTGSATTQDYEVNGNTDVEHGSSILCVGLGLPTN